MLPVLLAQADGLTETVDFSALAQSEAAAAAASTAAVGLGIGMIIFIIIGSIIGLIFLIWWIVLLIDLSKREFEQKSLWMVLMILSFFLGFIVIMDIVYYFAVKKPNLGAKAAV
jgi:glucan phosphoethanolaminetransferase (alkaline phosphatase superfamily)